MKITAQFLIGCLLPLLAMLVLAGCSKDNDDPKPDIVFAATLDGYKVSFKNQTPDVQSCKWDFGDGASSAEENPVHIYPGKGKYVPTLYVTMKNGVVYEGSTVLRIAKSSAVKLNDNTLSDWDTVVHNQIVSGAGGGTFKKAKYDYDGNYVYFYFELVTTPAIGDIFDFYMDTDNNSNTGLITWLFAAGGYDVLLEGTMFTGVLDVYYHTGAQSSFTFDKQSISDFFEIGTVVESGGILRFEGKLVRSKIKGLTGKGFKIGVSATKSDYTVIKGTAPDIGAPAFFVDMTE